MGRKDKYLLPRDYLIPKSRWDSEDLTGEVNVYNSQIIEDAFLKILDDFTPQYKFALISLCTNSRPYHKSRKYEKILNLMGEDVDVIVGSNGGIIPRSYWNCYPFLEYDAHREPEYDHLYCEKFDYRLGRFLEKFTSQYEKIVFLFTPVERNYPICEKYCKIYPNCVLIPSREMYDNIDWNEKYLNIYRRYKPAHPDILNKVCEELGLPQRAERIDSSQYTMNMEDVLNEVVKQLKPNTPYTRDELVEMMIKYPTPYNVNYMQMVLPKCAVNIDRTKWGKFRDLFIYVNNSYYLKESENIHEIKPADIFGDK